MSVQVRRCRSRTPWTPHRGQPRAVRHSDLTIQATGIRSSRERLPASGYEVVGERGLPVEIGFEDRYLAQLTVQLLDACGVGETDLRREELFFEHLDDEGHLVFFLVRTSLDHR